MFAGSGLLNMVVITFWLAVLFSITLPTVRDVSTVQLVKFYKLKMYQFSCPKLYQNMCIAPFFKLWAVFKVIRQHLNIGN